VQTVCQASGVGTRHETILPSLTATATAFSRVTYTILFIYPWSGLRAIYYCYQANGCVKLECRMEARTRIDTTKPDRDSVTKQCDTMPNVGCRFT